MRGVKLFFRALTVAVLVAAIYAVFHREETLAALVQPLIRDDQPYQEADLLVLLMGDASTARAELACSLYKSAKAPRIFFAEERVRGFVRLGIAKSAAQIHADFLANCGVPRDAMLIFACDTDSTVDEARCLQANAAKLGNPKRLIVITSWYHTARAGWLFQRILPDSQVRVAAAQNSESKVDQWWHEKLSIFDVMREYLKWVYWLTRPPSP